MRTNNIVKFEDSVACEMGSNLNYSNKIEILILSNNYLEC